MAQRGPKTAEGIRAVTRNLPPPEHSGPRTPRGKAVSSLNALRHGLSSEGFLRCKGERCYFRDACPLLATEEGREAVGGMEYGEPCPVEVSKFMILREMAVKELSSQGIRDEELASSLAMAEVRLDRARMLAAVEAGIVREVPVKGTDDLRPAPALSCRYKAEAYRVHSRLIMAFRELTEKALAEKQRRSAEREMVDAWMEHIGLTGTCAAQKERCQSGSSNLTRQR